MSEAGETRRLQGGLTHEDECPYLPGRRWQNLVVDTSHCLTSDLHENLLNQGFRRMANMMFKPMCKDCAECRPLRVDVRKFVPTRSQRRVWRRNEDISVSVDSPEFSEERRALLGRYLDARHVGPMSADEQSVRSYMYDTPIESMCFDYRVGRRLIASGIVDVLDTVTSSVYFFFDPDEARRSLGVYSMLYEIEYARMIGHRWFHPGFYVADCRAMNYKTRYGPSEVLLADGRWAPLDAPAAGCEGEAAFGV